MITYTLITLPVLNNIIPNVGVKNFSFVINEDAIESNRNDLANTNILRERVKLEAFSKIKTIQTFVPKKDVKWE